MTIDAAISRAYLHATGKAATPSTSKYNALLGLADSLTKMWAAEPDVEWHSLYQLVTTGTVSATADYDLDSSIHYISQREGDYIRVTNGSSTNTYTLVDPNQLYNMRGQAVAAQNGATLTFADAFTSSSPSFGYDIIVPSIVYVDDVRSGTQNVQVDDPMWLVFMIAAEFDRNNLIKVSQYGNLVNLANQHMEKMKQANGGQYDSVNTPWAATGMTWL